MTCVTLYYGGDIDKVSLKSSLHGDDAAMLHMRWTLENPLILSRFQIPDIRKAH